MYTIIVRNVKLANTYDQSAGFYKRYITKNMRKSAGHPYYALIECSQVPQTKLKQKCTTHMNKTKLTFTRGDFTFLILSMLFDTWSLKDFGFNDSCLQRHFTTSRYISLLQKTPHRFSNVFGKQNLPCPWKIHANTIGRSYRPSC